MAALSSIVAAEISAPTKLAYGQCVCGRPIGRDHLLESPYCVEFIRHLNAHVSNTKRKQWPPKPGPGGRRGHKATKAITFKPIEVGRAQPIVAAIDGDDMYLPDAPDATCSDPATPDPTTTTA